MQNLETAIPAEPRNFYSFTLEQLEQYLKQYGKEKDFGFAMFVGKFSNKRSC